MSPGVAVTDYEISQLTSLSAPALNDLLVIVDVNDHSTPPAGAGGSDKNITVSALLAAGMGVVLGSSGDTTGAADAAAVNAALGSFGSPGGIVVLQAGIWYLNAPLIVPAGVRLTGTLSDVNDIAVYGTTLNTVSATWAQGAAPFAAAVILNADSQADTFNLNCHFANSNAMDGITSNSTSNVHIHDINIYNGPQYGINARGNTWRGERVMVTQSVLGGFNAPASDSDWIDCNASASQAAGWICNNPINSRLIGCRAEFNTTRGYQITGDGTATGCFSMIGCSSDRNGTDGIFINNTGTSHIVISGMIQRRDGSSGGTTGAISIASTNTAPVIIGDHSIFPGFNDDGSGTDTPLTGITIGSGATYVAVTNAMVHAVTTPVSGTITQVRSVATRTGAWNSPSAVAMLPDTGGSFANSVTSGVVTLTYAATLNINAALGNHFRVTLTGAATVAAPTGPTDGQKITLEVIQDATGSRALSWNTAFDFGTPGAPVLTTTAAKRDLIGFVYSGSLSKWLYAGSALGFL
jgi:hypothetical protein